MRIQADDRHHRDGLGAITGDQELFWLPSASYLWKINPAWNLRAGLSRHAKSPAITELSSFVLLANGENSLANPDRGGNPALKPETMLQAQVGVEHFFSGQRGSSGLNFYWRGIGDRIQRDTSLEGARWVERPVNAGDADEISVVFDYREKLQSLPGLTLRGNANLSRIEFDDPARRESPRRTFNAGLDYDWPGTRLSISMSLNHQAAASSSDAINRRWQSAQTRLDISASHKLDKCTTLKFGVDNVNRAGRKERLASYAGGILQRMESDDREGVRVIHATLEGKF